MQRQAKPTSNSASAPTTATTTAQQAANGTRDTSPVRLRALHPLQRDDRKLSAHGRGASSMRTTASKRQSSLELAQAVSRLLDRIHLDEFDRPRAGEWFLLGEHLLLHAAPLMWFTDRTIVILQAKSPRTRCQDPTRREDAAGRRREQRGTATATTPRSSKAVRAPWVSLKFLLPQEQ